MSCSLFHGKRVAIAGGTGMIGLHCILELLKRGAYITTHTHIRKMRIEDERIEIIPQLDLTTLEDCLTLVNGCDYVIHLAGPMGHISEIATDFHATATHPLILSNILDACNKSHIERFLMANSSTGYPDRRHPVTEAEFWDDEPHISYYGYGCMRRYLERILNHASHITDMHIALIRLPAVFGPYDSFDLERCHVIPALIKRVLRDESPLIAWGDPHIVRDFLSAADCIQAGLLVMEHGKSMRPYNAGSGQALTIGNALSTILDITHKSPEVIWDNSKPTSIPFRLLNTQRIKNELGFKPIHPFRQAVAATINWYMDSRLIV
jgi:GDP-L-fucose synthase